MSSLAFRNCNPGNIRYNSRFNWRGQIGHRFGFCVFSDYRFGIRALLLLIDRYVYNRYAVTIEGIIKRYAPPAENDTNAYIDFVCSHTGIKRSERLVHHDCTPLIKIALAIVLFESNDYKHLTYSDVLDVYNLYYQDFNQFV